MWVRSCRCRFPFQAKILSHSLHGNVAIPPGVLCSTLSPSSLKQLLVLAIMIHFQAQNNSLTPLKRPNTLIQELVYDSTANKRLANKSYSSLTSQYKEKPSTLEKCTHQRSYPIPVYGIAAQFNDSQQLQNVICIFLP